ncbi:hypothetical protein IFVP182_C250002 [Vibrio parahaemolyticus]
MLSLESRLPTPNLAEVKSNHPKVDWAGCQQNVDVESIRVAI